jgi:quinol monooxygenase YgiN
LRREDGFVREAAADPHVFQVVARWAIKPGNGKKVKAALVDYVKRVRATEPDTYMYTANVPDLSEGSSFPPVSPDGLIYNSAWKDHAAFVAHSKGAPYQDFLAEHGHLFVQALGAPTTTQPYMTTSVLKRFAGFFRPEAFTQ